MHSSSATRRPFPAPAFILPCLHPRANSRRKGAFGFLKPHHHHHYALPHLRHNSMHPSSSHNFVSLLKACAATRDLCRGLNIYAELCRIHTFQDDVFIGTALVDMYSKCGSLVLAQEVFDNLPVRNVVTWNALLTGCVDTGCAEEALDYFEEMHIEGILPNSITFVCILKACGSIGATSRGQEIHTEVELWGLLQMNIYVGGALVDMYARNGWLIDGRHVFDKQLCIRDVVSWTALISGYVRHGHNEEALKCFEDMKLQDVHPNAFTMVHGLKACGNTGDAVKGQQMHSEIQQRGLEESNAIIGSALIHMYAKCGLLGEAVQMFEKLPFRDSVSWTSLIHGFVGDGHSETALKYFEHMQYEGVHADANTFLCILKACGSMGAIEKIIDIHSEIEKKGWLQTDISIGNSLVDTYVRCGYLSKAQEMFDKLHSRDIISWNTLLAGYAEQGHGEEVLKYLDKMLLEYVTPDDITFICALKACSSIQAINIGQDVHAEIERKGLFEGNISIGNSLIDMYAKCGFVRKAQDVFDRLLVHDIISWNALIGGYVAQDDAQSGLECCEQMQLEGICPDEITIVNILGACGAVAALRKGQEIHAATEMSRLLHGDLTIGSSLVDMYVNCGCMEIAQAVFDQFSSHDVVFWNVLILGFTRYGLNEKALTYFHQMHLEGVLPDMVTFRSCLKACGSIHNIQKGREIHADMERKGLLGKDVACSLVNLYAECGSLLEAQQVFNKLHVQDVNSWNALITGYVESEHGEKALVCFEQMQLEGVIPDYATVVSMLKACSSIQATEKGCEIHAEVERKGLQNENLFIASCLVEMYAKFGFMSRSRHVFDALISRDVVLWNTLITGYAELGDGGEALKCIIEMKLQGLSPNSVTYISTLKACGAIGALDMGQEIHSEIERKNLLGTDVVRNTLVDMYAKCGSLAEAQQLLKNLPAHDIIAWNSLIAGYAQLGEVDNVVHMFDLLLCKGLKPDSITFVILLTACSHLGLVNKSELYYEWMIKGFGLAPRFEHHSCMIDVLGRTGQLEKATTLMRRLQCSPDLVICRTILGACKKWGHLELGKKVFERAVQLDE